MSDSYIVVVPRCHSSYATQLISKFQSNAKNVRYFCYEKNRCNESDAASPASLIIQCSIYYDYGFKTMLKVELEHEQEQLLLKIS